MFTRKSLLQPEEFLISSAKRLLQQYLPLPVIVWRPTLGKELHSSTPDPFVMSPYEPLRSTMQAPPACRMSAQRLLAPSNVSVATRIW
jgi:hypothetical protein